MLRFVDGDKKTDVFVTLSLWNLKIKCRLPNLNIVISSQSCHRVQSICHAA